MNKIFISFQTFKEKIKVIFEIIIEKYTAE